MTDNKKILKVSLLPEVEMSAAQYYMDVKNGKQEARYIHPDMKDYTTNSVIIYQEQVMKFLVEIVGYSLEESDVIRAAIAKKKQDVMMATFDRIREATSKRGWTKEQSQAVCDQIQAFARYSFNRSHSRCYAELGYITMFLKRHHKLEWWASELNCSIDKEDKMRKYISLLGDLISPPSLESPSDKFEIRDGKIIAPLSVLKRVGGSCIKELVEKGPFKNLDDYIERVKHNKVNVGHFASLIKGRAADCFMDKSLNYGQARLKLMREYVQKRKSRDFNDDLFNIEPINIFLMERETNKCFNKTLLNDNDLVNLILVSDQDIVPTGRNGIPFLKRSTPILADTNVAVGLLDKGYEKDIGMILIFEGSNLKKGISKKTGKRYSMLKVSLSDGYNSIESVWWDQKKALNIPINSIVYVRGKISRGWSTSVSITINEFNRIA